MYTFVSDVLHVQNSTLDSFVFYAVAAIILGVVLFYFWKVLALGAFGIFCLSTIFSHNAALDAVAKNPDESLVKTQAIGHKKDFMEDCLTIAMNTKESCESIYNDKQ